MSDNTVRDDAHRLLFEERWFTPLFRACKEAGLDWLRMSAIARILSGGNPQMRTIDWDFIGAKLGPDNPLLAGAYDESERPSEEIIDRGTRWGLFQVHGEIAQQNGYKGQFAGLTSIDAGIKAGVALMKRALDELQAYADTQEEKASEAINEQRNDDAIKLMGEVDEIREGLPGNAEYRAFGVNGTTVDDMVSRMAEEFDRLRALQES